MSVNKWLENTMDKLDKTCFQFIANWLFRIWQKHQ